MQDLQQFFSPVYKDATRKQVGILNLGKTYDETGKHLYMTFHCESNDQPENSRGFVALLVAEEDYCGVLVMLICLKSSKYLQSLLLYLKLNPLKGIKIA